MAICVGANGRLGIRERSFGRARMTVWAGENDRLGGRERRQERTSLPAGPYLSPSGVVPLSQRGRTRNDFAVVLELPTNYHK